MLDLVEELLILRGGDGSEFRSVRIDGATCRARRNLSIRVFNDLTSDVRVMLISTRAGGLGINLATASDVVLLDQDWNPQITLQAEARAHRIGQKNPVTVYKLVSQGTVEEQMMGRIQKKLYLSAKVTEAMEDIHTKFGSAKKGKKGRPSDTDDSMPQLSTNQLMTLVRRGASAISRPEVDIDEMRRRMLFQMPRLMRKKKSDGLPKWRRLRHQSSRVRNSPKASETIPIRILLSNI
jgi:SWI/SNF-related matrix-associated actin-dependent regulator of chromatin subfamily A member 5